MLIGLGFQFLAWLMWRGRHKRFARGALVIGTAILVLSAFPVLTWSANSRRERIHPPFDVSAVSAVTQPSLIVVLGCGYNPDPWLSPPGRLDRTFTARLLEGIRVHRLLTNSRLLVSLSGDAGAAADKRRTLDELASILRLDPSRIELIADARSTLDEALATADQRREGESVIISTSAGHMPRAMDIFASRGLDPIAAPTDFRHPRPGTPADRPSQRWIPSTDGYLETQDWLYETSASLAAELGI